MPPPQLSQRQLLQITRGYRRAFGLTPRLLNSAGELTAPPGNAAFLNLPLLARARRDALEESLRWGEPYLYVPAPGLLSWVVPVVAGERCLGGLSGGEVVPEAAPERQATLRYLADAGAPRAAATAWLREVPVWPQGRTREAAEALFKDLYLVTGFTPELLRRNRESARQQRQIAEVIHEEKLGDHTPRPLELLQEEHMLLSLARVGDLAGARRVLNDMLARIFLYSPRMPLIQARVIEMLGYLVRAAVEDNPMLEPLLERHLRWIETIVDTREFEPLCMRIRGILDDFMEGIRVQGFNRSNRHVQAVLDHLAQHYTRPVSLDALAKLAGVNRFHLSRLVKAATGRSIPQHLRSLRIQAACRKLEESTADGGEIACALGFTDQSYFIKQFREVTGTTPRRYRAGMGMREREA